MTNVLEDSKKRQSMHCFIICNDPLHSVGNFKYPRPNVPSNHRWNKCVVPKIDLTMNLRTDEMEEKSNVGF